MDNIFIFGLRAEAIEQLLAAGSYRPWEFYQRDDELRGVLDAIRGNDFEAGEAGRFADIYRLLMEWGDYYLHLADYREYVDAQDRVSALYQQPEAWAEKAVLNVARMGKFSSDRAVGDYARKIWKIKPQAVRLRARALDELD